ncbi:MAG: four helix bundle protein [Candidatus Paceibacterota bacterium]|jgi:four helix bundle protein
MTIRNFTDLDAWQKSREVTLLVYKITKSFPADEKFALTVQMRRAAISVISNIAEGFGRSTARDKAHFYASAKGSLLEVQSQAIIAEDLGYLASLQRKNLDEKITATARLISGLINSAMDKGS